MKKFLLLWFIETIFVAIILLIGLYNLKIEEIQNTDTGALITIDMFGIDMNYYYDVIQ